MNPRCVFRYAAVETNPNSFASCPRTCKNDRNAGLSTKLIDFLIKEMFGCVGSNRSVKPALKTKDDVYRVNNRKL